MLVKMDKLILDALHERKRLSKKEDELTEKRLALAEEMGFLRGRIEQLNVFCDELEKQMKEAARE